MNRLNVIVLIKDGKDPEVYGSLKRLCEAKGYPYHTLKSKKFPFEYAEYVIYKVPV